MRESYNCDFFLFIGAKKRSTLLIARQLPIEFCSLTVCCAQVIICLLPFFR
jgi:hypothetical protein